MMIETNSRLVRLLRLSIVGAFVALLLIGAMWWGRNNISPEELVRRYQILAYGNPAMWRLTWLGVPTLQNPDDVWIIQEIISEVKPDLIIETGTARGGSAAIWAMVQREVNADGRVMSIDIQDVVERKKLTPSLLARIDFIVGSSIDSDVILAVKEKAHGKRVLVLLDSGHDRAHVLRELTLYSPLVCIGSYVIVQDTIINGHPVVNLEHQGPGPMEAVEEFLANNSNFQVDTSREKLMFTMHPKGYLKRLW